MEDKINHPGHYENGKIEVIDFIEDKGLGFNLGNVVKYVARAGKKKSTGKSAEAKALEDLKKAAWYLQREIRLREIQAYNQTLAHQDEFGNWVLDTPHFLNKEESEDANN